MTDVQKWLRRPKTSKEVTNANAAMAIKRAKDAGKVHQATLNIYFVPRWIDRLGNDWKMRDVVLYGAERFTMFLGHPNVRRDDSPDALRNVADVLYRICRRYEEFADELVRRAELIENTQDTETAAAD